MSLAMLGIYGVIAESVAQRVPEIGVRMALGARDSDAVRLILGQGNLDGGHWYRTGVAGAAALNRVMSGLVFGVRTHRSRVLHGGRRLSDDCDLGRVRHSSAPGRQNRSRPGAEAGLRSKPRRRNKCQVARGKYNGKRSTLSVFLPLYLPFATCP